VVAMQFEISDDAAITFATEFYSSMVDGFPVDAAVTEARKSIREMSSVEWGTPVLYMRSPDGALFDLQGRAVPEPVHDHSAKAAETPGPVAAGRDARPAGAKPPAPEDKPVAAAPTPASAPPEKKPEVPKKEEKQPPAPKAFGMKFIWIGLSIALALITIVWISPKPPINNDKILPSVEPPANPAPAPAAPAPDSEPGTYSVPGIIGRFEVREGYLVLQQSGDPKPLCLKPPGWTQGGECIHVDTQHERRWRNTPDGYVANGIKYKTKQNRGETVFEIPGTIGPRRLYVDNGYLYDYVTGMIVCPASGGSSCKEIETQYRANWCNTPDGFIANGTRYNRNEVVTKIRQGSF
jgi:hypothetical protein